MRQGKGKNAGHAPPRFEGLEGRALMSAAPLTVSTVSYLGGKQLKITGTSGADQITIKRTPAGMLITNTGGWSQTIGGPFNSVDVDGGAGNDSITLDASVTQNAIIYGSDGNDTLTGGNGADQIYGGAGADKCIGGAGNDTLVGGVGDGALDTLIGGTGNDNFWGDAKDSDTDISMAENSGGDVHRIGSFTYGNTSAPVDGGAKSIQSSVKNLVDPVLTDSALTYHNFSNDPLFAATGPSADDVKQGAVGDCYFLSTLSSITKLDPALIKQSVTDLGDGTYAVQFVHNGAKQFVRVDADLATYSWGGLAYADQGAQGSIWVAIMEKAFTFFRSGAGTYASISSGWMSEVYSDFGKTSSSWYSSSSAASLVNLIQSALDAGKSVTYAVKNAAAGAPLVGSHAYMVDSVVKDSTGKVTGVRLRNPWGVDGAGSDGDDDGYVTITPDQALASMLGLSIALV